MLKKILGGMICAFLSINTLTPVLFVEASTVPLDQLSDAAKYHSESQITGYKEVEKTGYKDVEKTGYKDVKVEKSGYKDVEYEREEQVTQEEPYTKEIPIYDWVTIAYYAKKGAFILKTPKLMNDNGFEVRTKDKWYTAATLDKEVKLTKVNDDFGKAYVSYTTYGDVPKKTNTHTAKQNTQAYTKTNTKYKLKATNSKGKKYYISVSKAAKLTKVNTSWYKKMLIYSDYKKVKGKWKKQTKKATVYVPAKYVKTSTKTVNVWIKQTKKANGYFDLNTSDIRTTTEWKQVGTRTETGTNTVTETVKVPYTVSEPYTYTEIEKQPYTYTEKEPYTYTDKEPIYETVKVENTLQEKYKTIINDYGKYRLTEQELYLLFDQVGVTYHAIKGYDLTRFVSGTTTVNGVSTSYRFTPTTKVNLLTFDDGTAINFSYLQTSIFNDYDDVKISAGRYQAE